MGFYSVHYHPPTIFCLHEMNKLTNNDNNSSEMILYPTMAPTGTLKSASDFEHRDTFLAKVFEFGYIFGAICIIVMIYMCILAMKRDVILRERRRLRRLKNQEYFWSADEGSSKHDVKDITDMIMIDTDINTSDVCIVGNKWVTTDDHYHDMWTINLQSENEITMETLPVWNRGSAIS